ncbi:unnamed protein product [Lathyrus oleraceus]
MMSRLLLLVIQRLRVLLQQSHLCTLTEFPGEPNNRPVHTKYSDHVTYRLWQGKDRVTLKVISHKSKMKNFCKILMSELVRRIVVDFGILAFADCSLTMLDASLLTIFVERWHKETSSFHLPFGEMTITLNDASSPFHLPICSRFFTAHVINKKLACMTVVRDLGVTEEFVLEEFDFKRGAQ